jgi:TRAP-type C4-dicarboxylate transport system substrate-binding protein
LKIVPARALPPSGGRASRINPLLGTIRDFRRGDGMLAWRNRARAESLRKIPTKARNPMTNAIARCVMIAVALLPVAAAAEPIKLKMAYFSSDREPPYVAVLQPFADAVNKAGKGIIEVVPYSGGVLGRNYSLQMRQVLDGVADMAWVNPSLTPDRFPDNDVLEFPGLFRDLREATLVSTRVVASGSLRGYEDFFAICAAANFPLMIHTRPPIGSLPDLRGKILRVNNLIEGNALKAIGITPVTIPINEVAVAIGRGTIDGATMPANALFAYGVSRITRFHYAAPLGAAPLAFLMNRRKFESLPKAGQDVIRKFSGEWTAARFVETYDANNVQAMNDLESDPNRQVIVPARPELDTLQATFQTVFEKWRQESPRNAQLLKLVENEIAKARAGD